MSSDACIRGYVWACCAHVCVWWSSRRMGALRQKRWRVKRQAGTPQEGPGGQRARGSPSSSPPAHSALLSDTSIDLSGRYDHRLAALLSTALFTSLACKQRLDTFDVRWCCFPGTTFSRLHPVRPTSSLPPRHKSRMNHQGALLDSLLPDKPNPNLASFPIVFSWGWRHPWVLSYGRPTSWHLRCRSILRLHLQTSGSRHSVLNQASSGLVQTEACIVPVLCHMWSTCVAKCKVWTWQM